MFQLLFIRRIQFSVLLAYLVPAVAHGQPLVFQDVLRSESSSVREKTPAGLDTFTLYGGPGSLEGKFQTLPGPAGVPDFGGWIGVDATESVLRWQLSTFNASNLNNNGPGNMAMWCGVSAAQEPGYVSSPGYGNNWWAGIEWTSEPLIDPSQPQTVDLQFFFNYDTEPAKDGVTVRYEQNGAWTQVFYDTGGNEPFAAPGVHFPQDVTAGSIDYVGNDYGGENGDQIRIRIEFASDGAWSDEDGTWPSVAGAVQVDDISVTYDNNGTQIDFTNFEGPGPFTWTDAVYPFIGDFSKLQHGFEDLDPCRSNNTGMVGFFDNGMPPSNLLNQPPYNDPPLSTGGSTSPNWNYGVPGGWVVNVNGGVHSNPNTFLSLDNEIWSPPIAWDLPGTADDDPDVAGVLLRFDVWEHLPLENLVVSTAQIRSSDDGGASWTRWRHNLAYLGDAQWRTRELFLGSELVANPTHVQVSLGVFDYSPFGTSSGDATPAPLYDNVSVHKYRIAGPEIQASVVNLYQDNFPGGGLSSFATLADRQQSDVRLDIARDVVPLSPSLVPGDETTATVKSAIPGVDVAQVKLVWVLDRNPWFDDVRVMPVGATEVLGGAANGWDQWTGEAPGTLQQFSTDDFDFDLPDVDFLHPGDVLRYHFHATDTEGRISTLPADLGGFADGLGWSRTYTVNGLPSVNDDGGSPVTPSVLLLDAQGDVADSDRVHRALAENGWFEGIHYDAYDWISPGGRLSNGIRSRAASSQLDLYDTILYVAGETSTNLFSDGSNANGNDKSDDESRMRVWHEQSADRSIVYFGTHLAEVMATNNADAANYLNGLMEVDFVDGDVRDDLGDPFSLQLGALVPCPGPSFALSNVCLTIDAYDNVDQGLVAVRSHAFLDAQGDPVLGPGRAASVLFDRVDGTGFRKVDMFFPFSLAHVASSPTGPTDPAGRSAAAVLLGEVLTTCLGTAPTPGVPVATPPLVASLRVQVDPNPFNPRTTVAFALPVAGPVSMDVFDARGRRVRRLLEEHRSAGAHSVLWDGSDDAGHALASGMYIVRVATAAETVSRKVALLR